MMFDAFGYSVQELLHHGPRSAFYRAVSPSDHAGVLIKIPNEGAPRLATIRALHREWDLLQLLTAASGVARALELRRDDDRYGLVLADVGGVPLHQFKRQARPVDLLQVVLGLCAALDQVHRRDVVHRCIHPAHVLVQPSTLEVSLVEFGCATSLGRQSPAPDNLSGFEGTLPYVSPEQTGRMNRKLDYRSDYYSLGVLLFELFTESLPFPFTNPLELVHAHIARAPPYPGGLNPHLPEALSLIILKLLAKDADNRYQSMRALQHDLEQCRTHMAAGEVEFAFALAADDRPERFTLPQRLYGRDSQVLALSRAFEQSRQGQPSLLVVSGSRGMGKSALVREVARPVAERRGCFAMLSFNQERASAPYHSLSKALEALVHQLFMGSAEAMRALRTHLGAISDAHAEVLVELCRPLRSLLGERRAATALPPSETRARLHQALAALLGRIASAGRSVCLAFDDLHDASPELLQLFEDLALAIRAAPVLLIATYREDANDPNETSDATQACAAGAAGEWRLALGRIADQGVAVRQLRLAPLQVSDVEDMIQDSFSLPNESARAIADLVCVRTARNPYFVRAFLESLVEDAVVERRPNGFSFDIERIRQRAATDNLGDLLGKRILKLSGRTRRALSMAACLGGRFELRTFHLVADAETAGELWPALEAELLLTTTALQSAAELRRPDSNGELLFAHERVREAILGEVSIERQQELRLGIARRLLSSDLEDPSYLFAICRHSNFALPLLKTEKERHQLAALNLRAGRSALSQGAGTEALALAKSGLLALGSDSWENSYDLTLELHYLAAECAFDWADHDTLIETVAKVVRCARTPVDAVRARKLEGRLYQSQGKSEAIAIYVAALNDLGVSLAQEPDESEIEAELRDTVAALGGRTPGDLVVLPPCHAAQMTLAMELLSKLILFTYSASHPLFPVAVCRLVRLSLLHGNTAESANGYTFYGLLRCRDQDLDGAFRFGQAALDIAHRFGDPGTLSQSYLFVNYQLMHWKLPLSALRQPLRAAYTYGLEAGSPRNAAASATTLCICRFWAGEELPSLLRDMEELRLTISQFRQHLVLNWHEVLLQAIQNLSLDVESPAQLAGPTYDESARVAKHIESASHSSLFNFYVSKALLCYLFDARADALKHADLCQRYASSFATAFWALPVAYLDALCRLALCGEVAPERRTQLIDQAVETASKLTSWLPHNPRAVEHKLRTIEAELARVRDDHAGAVLAFEQAAELAAASGVLHEEGIACELAARYFLRRGDLAMARKYMRAAFRAYERWGANTKVRWLLEQYPELIARTSEPPGEHQEVVDTQELDSIDLLGVLTASQAISTEIRPERLMQKLMSLLVESAGAQVGYLLLPSNGNWCVQAGRSSQRGELSFEVPLTIENLEKRGYPPVVESVVRVVAATAKTIVLDDASNSEEFRLDHQVVLRHVLSVLCFPLQRAGETIAVAYLENNLARGAFSPDARRVVELLCSQAVISFQHAQLYSNLEAEVDARTRELTAKNQELESALATLAAMQVQLATKEKLAALGALAAGVGHEIKNPLNFVTNFARIARRTSGEIEAHLLERPSASDEELRDSLGKLLPGLQRATEKIVEHGQRAADIVSRMSELASGSAGARAPADLNRLVAQSLSLACHGLGERALQRPELATDYDDNVGRVDIVAQDVCRVLVNLINNAQQALQQKLNSAAGSFRPVIAVTTRGFGDRVEVRIRDNGTGIAPSIRERLFEPFSTTKPAGQGIGLGLSISRDIVVAHGGEISVDSKPGEYCEFTVVLPRTSVVRGSERSAPVA